MKNTKRINQKDLLAAEAVVNVALIRLEDKNKLGFHPHLKQLIAHEIAADPSLTMDLFGPNFLNKFVNKTSPKNS